MKLEFKPMEVESRKGMNFLQLSGVHVSSFLYLLYYKVNLEKVLMIRLVVRKKYLAFHVLAKYACI